MKRIYSIDFTRGLVMIIMALDHVRDMIHVNSIDQSPTNLASTTPLLFFTRWIIYLCAPAFIFLAGTSAALSMSRSKDIQASRKFMFTRGLYLVLLEFTVVNFGLFFDLGFHNFIFEVIAAIGFGFMILAFVCKVPAKILGIAGLLIICLHNALAYIPFVPVSGIKGYLQPLFSTVVYPFSGNVLIMGYPPLPWLGIMLCGFAAARLFAFEEEKRKKIFITIALSALILFAVIRMLNIYGDPVEWSQQKDALYSFLSFMNVTKYPPSLLFCLVTLGIMFLMLAWSEGKNNKLVSVVSVYGKAPLFYFLVHFFVIHFILLIILRMQGVGWSQMEFAGGTFGRPKGITTGLPLSQVYLIWIAVVAGLYYPCKMYGKYKERHNYRWLKFL